MKPVRSVNEIETMEVDVDENVDPSKASPWFDQFQKLDVEVRAEIIRKTMANIKKMKPETYDFIRKFKCEVVGVTPRIEYILKSGMRDELDVTWIHAFGSPTLLFWCKQGGFGFFVNPNLRYNDSVLNDLKENKKQELRGFTS